MVIFLDRILHRMRRRGWVLPLLVVGGVFVTSWPLMALAEGPHAAIVAPSNYWWWFLITSSTVGYGDFYPATAGGHVVGIYVVIGGIATLTTLFAQIAGLLEAARGRRMRGAVTVTSTDHTLILGYAAGRTEQIVDELVSDDPDRPVVLATSEIVPTNPMPERPIQFVRGDLSAETVLRRAGADTAATVLIDAADDNEALTLALSVNHLAPRAHTVVALRDLARAVHLGYINPAMQAVPWHSQHLITEEIQSPGISRVYGELMTFGGQNTYSLALPETVSALNVADCQAVFRQEFAAMVLAVDTGEQLVVNPPGDTMLPAGATIYYVCRQRIAPQHLHRAVAGR